jgi:hypothetical protein
MHQGGSYDRSCELFVFGLHMESLIESGVADLCSLVAAVEAVTER